MKNRFFIMMYTAESGLIKAGGKPMGNLTVIMNDPDAMIIKELASLEAGKKELENYRCSCSRVSGFYGDYYKHIVYTLEDLAGDIYLTANDEK